MIWQYLLPFIILAQTATPSATLVTTPNFTPTPIISLQGNIFITEISPTSDTEWTEIYNAGESQLQLTKCKLLTETTSRNIPDNTVINSKSYFVFNSTSFLSDSIPKTVRLVDQNSNQIDIAVAYPASMDNGLSWSKQLDNSWCQTFPTSGLTNNTCYIPPTAIPPTNTPVVPTVTSIPPTSIPSVITTNTPTISPTAIPTNTPFSSPEPTVLAVTDFFAQDHPEQNLSPSPVLNGKVLGTSTTNPTVAVGLAGLLPLIFIIAGGILLASPLIISQIKIKWLPKR